MPVLRMSEIAARRRRKMQLRKLRERYQAAKGAIDKEKIVTKVSKIAPWLTEEQFLAPTKKK